jgi:NAD-dependent deacetylase
LKIVVLTGAGMSAESGVSTFRDAGGLWEGHDVMEVASPQGWEKNPQLVLEFYNQRRRQLHQVQPHAGHLALSALQNKYQVQIVTQNVDNLHERAGSQQVLHLHGELMKVRSTGNENYIVPWENDLNLGDTCPSGFQLRPHIVWFGEAVPAMHQAITMVERAEVVVVIGTSLQVYPAAGLLNYAASTTPIFYIDPKPAAVNHFGRNIQVIPETAGKGVPLFIEKLNQL